MPDVQGTWNQPTAKSTSHDQSVTEHHHDCATAHSCSRTHAQGMRNTTHRDLYDMSNSVSTIVLSKPGSLLFI